jgi:hypothetical protein
MSDHEDSMTEDATLFRHYGEEYMGLLLDAAKRMRESFSCGEELLGKYIAAMELASKHDLPWDPYEMGERVDFASAAMRDAVENVLRSIPEEPQFSYEGQDVKH